MAHDVSSALAWWVVLMSLVCVCAAARSLDVCVYDCTRARCSYCMYDIIRERCLYHIIMLVVRRYHRYLIAISRTITGCIVWYHKVALVVGR